jgi:hypothetical protein
MLYALLIEFWSWVMSSSCGSTWSVGCCWMGSVRFCIYPFLVPLVPFVHIHNLYWLCPFRVETRDTLVHTHKWAKVWYPYILGLFGVHWRNICCITAGSTWASPCQPPCVTDFVCIILKLDSHQRLVGIYLFHLTLSLVLGIIKIWRKI